MPAPGSPYPRPQYWVCFVGERFTSRQSMNHAHGHASFAARVPAGGSAINYAFVQRPHPCLGGAILHVAASRDNIKKTVQPENAMKESMTGRLGGPVMVRKKASRGYGPAPVTPELGAPSTSANRWRPPWLLASATQPERSRTRRENYKKEWRASGAWGLVCRRRA